MDRASNYQWKAGICQTGRQYFCQAKAPNCPDGYTWLPLVGQTCFKVVDTMEVDVIDSSGSPKTYYSEQKANKFCESQGTRLATVTTTQQQGELWSWLSKDDEDLPATKLKYIMGFRGESDNVWFNNRMKTIKTSDFNSSFINSPDGNKNCFLLESSSPGSAGGTPNLKQNDCIQEVKCSSEQLVTSTGCSFDGVKAICQV